MSRASGTFYSPPPPNDAHVEGGNPFGIYLREAFSQISDDGTAAEAISMGVSSSTIPTCRSRAESSSSLTDGVPGPALWLFLLLLERLIMVRVSDPAPKLHKRQRQTSNTIEIKIISNWWVHLCIRHWPSGCNRMCCRPWMSLSDRWPLDVRSKPHEAKRSGTKESKRDTEKQHNQNESLNRNGNGTERGPYMYRLIIPSADRTGSTVQWNCKGLRLTESEGKVGGAKSVFIWKRNKDGETTKKKSLHTNPIFCETCPKEERESYDIVVQQRPVGIGERQCRRPRRILVAQSPSTVSRASSVTNSGQDFLFFIYSLDISFPSLRESHPKFASSYHPKSDTIQRHVSHKGELAEVVFLASHHCYRHTHIRDWSAPN